MKNMLVVLTFLLLASHATGSFFDWYTEFVWFPEVLHFLGGAWLATVFLATVAPRLPRWFMDAPLRVKLRRLVLVVVLAGAAWELYELGFATYATAVYGDLGFYQSWMDTVWDLLLDAVGAAFVALIFFRKPGSETSTSTD